MPDDQNRPPENPWSTPDPSSARPATPAPGQPGQGGQPGQAGQQPPLPPPYQVPGQPPQHGQQYPYGQQAQPPYGQPSQPYGQPPQPYGQPPAYGQAPQLYGQHGQPYGAGQYGYPVAPRTPGRATAVLVCGIGSLVMLFTCGLGFIPAIVALCLAPGARRDIRASNGQLTGEGQVRGGVICSWIAIAITVLFVAVIVGLFAFGSSDGGSSGTVDGSTV